MNTYVVDLIKRYKSKGVFIDTNVALLYLVGSIDISLISRIKRTSMFTIDQLTALSAFVDEFKVRVTSPHILTEMSNLLPTSLQSGLGLFIGNIDERFVSAVGLVGEPLFSFLGLADASVAESAKSGFLIISDDTRLTAWLRREGQDAVSVLDLGL